MSTCFTMRLASNKYHGLFVIPGMDKNQLNNLAANIAKVVVDESSPVDLAALAKSIERLNDRLDRLESASLQPNILPFPAPIDPSRERFAIPEPIDEHSSAASHQKICTFEPHARPCDYCSMCTARGF